MDVSAASDQLVCVCGVSSVAHMLTHEEIADKSSRQGGLSVDIASSLNCLPSGFRRFVGIAPVPERSGKSRRMVMPLQGAMPL